PPRPRPSRCPPDPLSSGRWSLHRGGQRPDDMKRSALPPALSAGRCSKQLLRTGKGPAMSTDVGTSEDRTSTEARRPERTNGGGRTGGPPAAAARTAQRTGESGTGWWMLAAAMGSVLALAVALVAVVIAGSSDGD